MKDIAAMLTYVALAVGILLLSSCSHYPRYENRLPHNAVEIEDRSGMYRRWWNDVEKCTGKRTPMRGVRVYVVMRSANGFAYNGQVLSGLAYAGRGTTVLSTDAMFDSAVVRHEFLHLQASPEYHNPEFYQRRCRAIVTCTDHCVADSIHPRDKHP